MKITEETMIELFKKWDSYLWEKTEFSLIEWCLGILLILVAIYTAIKETNLSIWG
jgi:hypothetical protein